MKIVIHVGKICQKRNVLILREAAGIIVIIHGIRINVVGAVKSSEKRSNLNKSKSPLLTAVPKCETLAVPVRNHSFVTPLNYKGNRND